MDSELKNMMKKDLNIVNKVTKKLTTVKQYSDRFKKTGKGIMVRKGKHMGNFQEAINDRDKDGVPDAFDCEPNNPKKQGLVHNIAKGMRDKLANKIIEYRENEKQKKEIQHKIRTGKIKNIEDAKKEYGQGTNLSGFAVQQIRNKELREELAETGFQTRKEVLIQQQTQRIKKQLTGDPNYGYQRPPQRRRPKITRQSIKPQRRKLKIQKPINKLKPQIDQNQALMDKIMRM